MKKIITAIGESMAGGLLAVAMIYGGLAIYSVRMGLPMPW